MKKNLFLFLASLFCVALIVSNIIAGKLYSAPFGLVLPAAVWLFPIVYILGDVIPEVYGLKKARQVIWLGFFLNVFAVAFFMLTLILPYPGFWPNQSAFQAVLGFTPRLLLASFVAYLVGTNVNAQVLVWIKKLTSEKYLWIRTIGSTIFGESLDSLLFISIAFYGSMPNIILGQMVLAQAGFKILYETLATPLTYLVVNYVKKNENCVD
jgi:queuosine precursor transporter